MKVDRRSGHASTTNPIEFLYRRIPIQILPDTSQMPDISAHASCQLLIGLGFSGEIAYDLTVALLEGNANQRVAARDLETV